MNIGDIVAIAGSEYKIVDITSDEYGNKVIVYAPVV